MRPWVAFLERTVEETYQDFIARIVRQQRMAEMKLKEDDVSSMIMSFQVVEVHKPLLAVSRLVEAGHDVKFSKTDPHILLSTGAKIPMKCNMGTYEIEVWILNPGFTGPR